MSRKKKEPSDEPGPVQTGRSEGGGRPKLAFTRYFNYQYCMVHILQTRVRRESRILPNNRATILHEGRQCRWADVDMVDSCTTASQENNIL